MPCCILFVAVAHTVFSLSVDFENINKHANDDMTTHTNTA
jgi:hypothetical protein